MKVTETYHQIPILNLTQTYILVSKTKVQGMLKIKIVSGKTED
jgi:hypothetical protein